jgi:hypothetical protein
VPWRLRGKINQRKSALRSISVICVQLKDSKIINYHSATQRLRSEKSAKIRVAKHQRHLRSIKRFKNHKFSLRKHSALAVNPPTPNDKLYENR